MLPAHGLPSGTLGAALRDNWAATNPAGKGAFDISVNTTDLAIIAVGAAIVGVAAFFGASGLVLGVLTLVAVVAMAMAFQWRPKRPETHQPDHEGSVSRPPVLLSAPEPTSVRRGRS